MSDKLILAVENSSDIGSVALVKETEVLAESSWNAVELRSPGLFSILKEMLAGQSVTMENIAGFVIDVGPGAYSGLRASMAAVRAFALPDNKPIYAITSAEALAFEIMNECPGDIIQVVGDARRQQWWNCVYQSNGDVPVVHSNLCLVAENDFKPAAGALVVSPDWHRIGDKLINFTHRNLDSKAGRGAPGLSSGGIPAPSPEPSERAVHPENSLCLSEREKVASRLPRIINARKVPKAGWLGKLACRKMRLKIASEPLTPIYLHAAVSERHEARSQ